MTGCLNVEHNGVDCATAIAVDESMGKPPSFRMCENCRAQLESQEVLADPYNHESMHMREPYSGYTWYIDEFQEDNKEEK